MGITINNYKIIKGIVLNKNSLNSFENVLFCCIDNFRPKIQNNKIKIYIRKPSQSLEFRD